MTRLMPMGLTALVFLATLAGCTRTSGQSSSPAPSAPLTRPAVDHQVGNGGGGVCLMGTCRTLAEAGLRIAGPEEEFYVLPPALVKEVRALLASLPVGGYGDELFKRIIGAGKTFKRLTVVEPEKLELIRERYAALLAAQGSTIDMKTVKIFAFASGNASDAVTYLLPEFFALDLTQQAKILIHENNVRIYVPFMSDFPLLKNVLEFDGMMEELLANPANLLAPTFRIDRWEMLLSVFSGDWATNSFRKKSSSSFVHWLHWLKANLGIVIPWESLCEKRWTVTCSFDVPQFSSQYNVPPSFIRLLSEFGSVDLEYPYGDTEATRLKNEQALQACQGYLHDRAEISIFHPYELSSGEYRAALLVCKKGDGVLTAKAMDISD